MADYVLRGVTPELWRQFKQRATNEGHSMRWLLLALIEYYIAHGVQK